VIFITESGLMDMELSLLSLLLQETPQIPDNRREPGRYCLDLCDNRIPENRPLKVRYYKFFGEGLQFMESRVKEIKTQQKT